MALRYFDFAQCKCGHRTPLRPSMSVPEAADQTLTGTDAELVSVACVECKRVYIYDLREAESILADMLLSPYDRDAPMRVFEVPLRCDELGCSTPLPVIAVRKTDTSSESLENEVAKWRWSDLKCPEGHPIPWPEWS